MAPYPHHRYTLRMRTLLFSLVLMGCSGSDLVCGPGTVERDGQCLPDTPADSGSSPQDTAPPVDTAPPEDTAAPAKEPALVYLLAGQSNMVGVGQVTALPPSLRDPIEDVQLYWSGREGWTDLQPSSDYSSSWGTYMGPEITFGRAMKDAHPDRDVYLIKHADGGTALADWWNPGADPSDTVNQGAGYTTFRDTVTQGLGRLDTEGVDFEIAGMIWMQGESDAYYSSYAHAYQANLTHFIDRVREDVAVDDLPFIIGEIHCLGVCPYRDTVIDAERAVAAKDANVRSFDTLDLERFPDDDWHYAGIGQRVLGERFAQSLLDEPELAPFPTAAIEITGSYTYSYYGAYTVGWAFTALEDLQITDLGVFDLGDDGLYHNTLVGIWDEDTEELLIDADVYGAGLYETAWHGGFRFVGIDEITLPAGNYRIGNISYSWTPDYYVYNAGITESDSVDWLGAWHYSGNVLTFPTVDAGSDQTYASWFGPNFLFETVGE